MAQSRPTILQVIPALDTGGAEKTTIDIALAIEQRGWRPIVASRGGWLVKDLEREGITHITLPLASKNPLTIWRNATELQKLMAREKVDIVHARSRAPAWSCLLATHRTNTPFVTTYHGAYSQKGRIKAWYNSVMARADVIIGNSEWTADLVRQRRPEAAERVVAIPRGTDFTDFSQARVSKDRGEALREAWGLKPDDFVALHLARVSQLKDQPTVISAATLLRNSHPNLKVVLAGDAQGRDDYLASLKKQIADAGMEERIILPGHCDDPAAAFAISDVMLSSSKQPETFGRVAVEAAALEKPVIVTNIGAVVETVLAPPDVSESERTGWKVPPQNPQALADALVDVMALSHKDSTALGSRARDHVTARFSLARMCDETLTVYEKLLKKRGRL